MPKIPAPDWDVQPILDGLASHYPDDDTWRGERKRVEARVRSLAKILSPRYGVATAQGVGGNAIVLRVEDRDLLNQPCAVKFPRPLKDRDVLLKSMMEQEISHLATLRHSAIVRIHGKGELEANGHPPYYIMDFVEGKKSLDFIRKAATPLGRSVFVQMVESTLDALAYMHSHQVAHLDIKPDNILVGLDGAPVISDLGSAKYLGSQKLDYFTALACDRDYADDRLEKKLPKDPSDSRRAKGEVLRSEIETNWDLVPMGRSLLNWLGYDQRSGEKSSSNLDLEPFDAKYLLLLALRLTRGQFPEALCERVGLRREELEEFQYETAADALQDVRKLSGRYSIVDAIKELNVYHPKTLKVSADAATPYTPPVAKAMSHPALRRLRSITQLGVVSEVYPTARHSRLEHSLGTYHVACRFALSLYYDPLSPVFRQLMTESDIRALLLAALLHDVGQYPLAHDLEEVAPEVFGHDALTVAIICREKGLPGIQIDFPDFSEVCKEWQVQPARVVEILQASEESSVKDRILHSIVDGGLDADKLDYVRRDADGLKIPYASGVDLERILRNLTVVLGQPKGGGGNHAACVGVHEKARVAAESVAIARYSLFTQAYWHHTVRSMKAMLARAVLKLLMLPNTEEKSLRNAFMSFVLSLPRVVRESPCYAPQPLFGVTGGVGEWPAVEDGDADDLPATSSRPGTDSTIDMLDAAVIGFLWARLKAHDAPESGLLEDLLCRKLYKRLFVLTLEPDNPDWNVFVESWDQLASPELKIQAYEHFESSLLRQLPAADTEALVAKFGDEVKRRKPLILVDFPGRRSSHDLFYVAEAERRKLRTDERVSGQAEKSEVWDEFGVNLHRRAGKVRVFCHPELADALDRSVRPNQFLNQFKRAVEKARRDGA